MALSSNLSLWLSVVLTCCCLSQSFIFEEEVFALTQWTRKLAENTCGPVDCVHGTCSVISAFPFYHCQCNDGWQSPLNESWIPCIIPNCSLNLSCNGNKSSLTAPSPAVSTTNGIFSFCSLPVCGDGDCVSSGNTSLSYECNCNSGSLNLFNSTSGYCVPKCSLGTGCSSLNVTLGSSSSGGLSSNQGLKPLYTSALIIWGFWLLKIGW